MTPWQVPRVDGQASIGRIGSTVVLVLWLLTLSLPAGGTTQLPDDLAAAEAARIAAIEKACSATIAVFGAQKAGGGGSGVLISPDGYALTNFHVVQPCGNHMKCGLNDGRLYDAVVVGIDPTGDVALIKLLGRDDFPVAEMADSDQVRVGDECFAVGNPFLLATDLQPTVTYGIVSGVGRYQPPAAGAILEYTDCIQTDAAINPGNSGGPLFNAQGQLIGINGRGSFEKRGRVNVGVGYAISINQVKNFLGVLRSGRIVDHATLGATAATDAGNQVVVTNILDSSDAFRRGLRYGDQIVALAGRTIDSANTLKNVLGILPKGWRVPLVFQRGDQRIETYVRLAGVHSEEALLRIIERSPVPEDGQRPRPVPGQKDPQEDDAPPRDEKQPDAKPGDAGKTDQEQPADESPSPIAGVFHKRRGYANYHFNLLERARVWLSLQQHTPAESLAGRWILSGRIGDQGTLHLSMDDRHLYARLSTPEQNQEIAIDTSATFDQREPRNSGGLYLALHQWRRLLTRGPDQFGEVFYWGTAPLPHQGGQFDVLVGIHDVVETRFYFDPASGQLVALEMFPDANVDPCEVTLSDYRSVDGRQLPHRFEIRYGDHTFGVFTVDRWDWEPTADVPARPDADAGSVIGEDDAQQKDTDEIDPPARPTQRQGDPDRQLEPQEVDP